MCLGDGSYTHNSCLLGPSLRKIRAMSEARNELANLPTDLDALRALVNERLQHLLLKLRHLRFSHKSERLPEDQRQPALEDLEQAVAQV